MKKILVVDFGSQFAQLVATRIRSLGAYSDICAPEDAMSKILEGDVAGVVFSGGPASVYEEGSPTISRDIFELGLPILGICYGHQLITHLLGGEVVSSVHAGEFGKAAFRVTNPKGIFEGLPSESVMWMSHGDETVRIPEGFEVVGDTKACPIGATCNLAKNIYTVQFHPEVVHSEYGNDLLDNFVKLCGIKDTWSMEDFVDMCIAEVREQVGTKNVFLMVSGGVDSSVVFALLNKALGKERVFGMFVDTGLLRYEEAVEVQEFLQNAGFDNLHTAYESERFLGELKEQYDPEVKRGIIGNAFLDVQRDVSSDLNLNPDDWYLAQGTIFPDTIETGGSKHSVKIKTHHNRVEQIQRLIEQGKLVEPLKMLFKDEVRQVARLLNLPEKMIERHPFPGPGLGVRILCAQGGDVEVRAGELEGVFEDRYGYGFRLLPIRSVGVQGDFRTFAHPVAIFTDEFDRSKLAEIATEIPNNHREINRVILCLSSENKEDFEVRPSHIDTNRVEKLQLADKITMDIIREAGLYNKIWQFPVVLAPVFNSQGESIILRPIESTDAMTAVSSDIPFGILRQIGDEILERVDGIGSVFYDLTSKPPATIEWE